MSLVPVDNAHITQAIISDAQYLASVIDWVNKRYKVYSTQLAPSVIDAAGINATDKNSILVLISDLYRIAELTSGNLPADANDSLLNIANLLGLTGN